MCSEMEIILVSETSSLKINFEHTLDVKNKKIALLGFQSPDIDKSFEGKRREKRVPKDSYFVGDSLTMVVHCDKIVDNVFVNKTDSFNFSSPIKSLGILRVKSGLGYNSIEIKNPKYYNLNTESLSSLDIELRDLNENMINFDPGYIVVNLGIRS